MSAFGVLVTRNSQRITPNEGLLVVADIMLGLLVVSIPVGRAGPGSLIQNSDSELRRIRASGALEALPGRR
jgi:hypothetical protein